MRIGLTGGIGSGKSTVGALLAAQGALLVDTDAIARTLAGPGGAALPEIHAAFGPAVFDAAGALERRRMRERVFADPAAKVRLEAILHPRIRDEALQQADAAGGRPVVFDVPLLAESPAWRSRTDRILVVDCSEPTQITRVSQRPGWTPEMAAQVVAQQASRRTRRAIADALLHNDGITLAALQAQVATLWATWIAQEASAPLPGVAPTM